MGPPRTLFLNRRCFIGGSDARIVMGSDEAALRPLLMLWTGAPGDRRKVDGASPSR